MSQIERISTSHERASLSGNIWEHKIARLHALIDGLPDRPIGDSRSEREREVTKKNPEYLWGESAAVAQNESQRRMIQTVVNMPMPQSLVLGSTFREAKSVGIGRRLSISVPSVQLSSNIHVRNSGYSTENNQPGNKSIKKNVAFAPAPGSVGANTGIGIANSTMDSRTIVQNAMISRTNSSYLREEDSLTMLTSRTRPSSSSPKGRAKSGILKAPRAPMPEQIRATTPYVERPIPRVQVNNLMSPRSNASSTNNSPTNINGSPTTKNMMLSPTSSPTHSVASLASSAATSSTSASSITPSRISRRRSRKPTMSEVFAPKFKACRDINLRDEIIKNSVTLSSQANERFSHGKNGNIIDTTTILKNCACPYCASIAKDMVAEVECSPTSEQICKQFRLFNVIQEPNGSASKQQFCEDGQKLLDLMSGDANVMGQGGISASHPLARFRRQQNEQNEHKSSAQNHDRSSQRRPAGADLICLPPLTADNTPVTTPRSSAPPMKIGRRKSVVSSTPHDYDWLELVTDVVEEHENDINQKNSDSNRNPDDNIISSSQRTSCSQRTSVSQRTSTSAQRTSVNKNFDRSSVGSLCAVGRNSLSPGEKRRSLLEAAMLNTSLLTPDLEEKVLGEDLEYVDADVVLSDKP